MLVVGVFLKMCDGCFARKNGFVYSPQGVALAGGAKWILALLSDFLILIVAFMWVIIRFIYAVNLDRLGRGILLKGHFTRENLVNFRQKSFCFQEKSIENQKKSFCSQKSNTLFQMGEVPPPPDLAGTTCLCSIWIWCEQWMKGLGLAFQELSNERSSFVNHFKFSNP